MLFRKKQIIIDAIQWDGENFIPVSNFLGEKCTGIDHINKTFGIETLEGEYIARKGDWIIRGVKGEYYPCKPDVFELTYEKVE